MYRLLAIDLDGTLLTPQKEITPHTHHLLCQIAQAGIAIVIATGQTSQVLRAVCADLPLTAPQIIENGALVIDLVRNAILHEQLIPDEYILPALVALRSFGLYRVYHTHERVYPDKDTPRVPTWSHPPVPPVIKVENHANISPHSSINVQVT